MQQSPPEESGSTDNAELARVRADLAASQQRMQATEARIQALTQQQQMQGAENQGLRQQLQVMGTKMQRAQGRMNQMQRQGSIARREMETLSQQASAMSQEAPEPSRHPQFAGPLGGIRNDMDGIARQVAQSAVAHPGRSARRRGQAWCAIGRARHGRFTAGDCLSQESLLRADAAP
ncbi:MAG: hypothetical protein IPF99_35690 [Deltaproteobacteria bacterium]|nr:hypothetical protein [Deltaproteobacteria bacterium]